MSAQPEGSSEGDTPNTTIFKTTGKVFLARELSIGDSSDVQAVKYRLAISETLLNIVVGSIHSMIEAKDPMIKIKFDDQLEKMQASHPDVDFDDQDVKAEHGFVIKFISEMIEKFDILSQWQDVAQNLPEAIDRDLRDKVRSNSLDRCATVQRTIDEEMMDKSKDPEHMGMLGNFADTIGLFTVQDNPENLLSKIETMFKKFEAITSDLLSNQDFDKTGNQI